jgi:DNA-binding MarR family transcriptional regulator
MPSTQTRRPAPLRLIPRVHRATHRIGLHIAGWRGFAVTQAEAHILDHLATAGPCSIGALHRAFAHRRSTLTSVLDRLTDRKFIRREASPDDRRSFIVTLTPAGRKAAARVHQQLHALERRALAGVPTRDLEAFERVLERLERTIAGN